VNRDGFNPVSGLFEPGISRNGQTFFVRMSYLFRKNFEGVMLQMRHTSIKLLVVTLLCAALLFAQPSSRAAQQPGVKSTLKTSRVRRHADDESSSLAALRARIEEISRSSRGRVGVAVALLESGQSVDFKGSEHFPMQSVYKLPIGMTLLQHLEGASPGLDEKVIVRKADLVPSKLYSPIREEHPSGDFEISVRELLRRMLVESDGTASDVLLRIVGGPARVNEYLRGLGVRGIVVATTEAEMAGGDEVQYRNWATPLEMLKLLRALQEGRALSGASRALLLQFMTESVTGPHRIRGLLPEGTVVAHKTGTSGSDGGLARATNDAGIITLPDGRHLAVVVFVSDSRADEATREGVIAKVARAAWDWAAQSH
jgi:beta-lactamase class A